MHGDFGAEETLRHLALAEPPESADLLEGMFESAQDAAQGFAHADVILEGTYSTSWQEHAYLQPEAGIGYIDEQGRVVVETAGQWLHEDRRQIAEILGLPEEQVVVRYAAIGGAFGGREDLSIQHLLALAAWKLHRPVSLVWRREESMIAHHKRLPMTVHCRWGARRDGQVTAVEARVLADGGAYASTSVEVTKVATLFASGCYEVPNISINGYVAYTNNVPSGVPLRDFERLGLGRQFLRPRLRKAQHHRLFGFERVECHLPALTLKAQ